MKWIEEAVCKKISRSGQRPFRADEAFRRGNDCNNEGIKEFAEEDDPIVVHPHNKKEKLKLFEKYTTLPTHAISSKRPRNL
ncbi:hypothetical protein DPMN_110209 [Dreissena polymorpha]|uniref:Uncharacterized protein n=1 Tax=Dreissena polymorpha TaxID=45954 RepID=A0A9D4QMU1_DREPO|nr:hypothetical protein DPMN_110209 [Dreissena polymorpha]